MPNWDERYASGDYPTAPSPLVLRAATHLPPGRALDVACGAGRHAHWLAERGWEVVAVDRSPAAVALARGPSIDARVLDLEREPLPSGEFDLVLLVLYFDRDVYRAAAERVRPGGLVVASAKLSGSFAAAPGELPTLFAGFAIVEYREGDVAELIARCDGGRPGASGGWGQGPRPLGLA